MKRKTSVAMEYARCEGRILVNHRHWEIDSECPQCGNMNHVLIPEGERVVRVHCEHCTHGYEYTHIVQGYHVVEDKE